MRRVMGFLCGLALVMSLAGCGSSVKFEPSESGIFVDRDGTVVSAEIESFDNSGFTEERYSEEGLRSFVEEAVIAYNRDACGQESAYAQDAEEPLSVSIESLEVASKQAVLYLDYASCEDYLAFTGEEDDTVTLLSVMTAADAGDEGISLEGLVDEDGAGVDTSKMQGSTRYYVVTIAGRTNLTVNGRIAAVSEGVTVKDKHTVRVSGGEPVCIVFR